MNLYSCSYSSPYLSQHPVVTGFLEQSSTSVDAILLAPFPLHAWKLAGLNRAVAAIERGKTKMSLVGCNSIHIFTPEALSNGMKTIKAFAAALKKERERERNILIYLLLFFPSEGTFRYETFYCCLKALFLWLDKGFALIPIALKGTQPVPSFALSFNKVLL